MTVTDSRWSWTLLRAGSFKLDGGAMFGLTPRPLWERLVTPDDRHRIPLQQNCLLLEREGSLVLIEAGIGDKLSDKLRAIYDQERRTVADAIREVGRDPAEVRAVIVTHLHFDHAGGLTRVGDAGAAVPTFPNAEVVVQRQEWADALANKSTMHSTYLRDHLDPIADRVRLIDGEAEALPGIKVWPMPGHTWGQQAVRFTDDAGRTVVFPGDVMPTIHHAGPATQMAYDMLPYENMLQKRALLERAHAEGWLIVLDHEPGDPAVRAEPNPDRPGQHRLIPASG